MTKTEVRLLYRHKYTADKAWCRINHLSEHSILTIDGMKSFITELENKLLRTLGGDCLNNYETKIDTLIAKDQFKED